MPVNVFVSCTRGDLDKDCRPWAIHALGGHAVAVDMDRWVLDSTSDEDAIIDLCHVKLRDDSNHYFGIFAYRRGWVPGKWQPLIRSITEAEYDWARKYQKRMAVFLPHPLSGFALELRQRAEGQSAAEDTAQKTFLNRVRGETPFMEFKHPGHLVERVKDTLQLWQGGGLRQMSRDAQARHVARVDPPDEDFLNLGHTRQARVFEESFERLCSPGMPRAACFLVSGPPDYGQDQLVRRLQSIAQKSLAPPPRCISVPIGVSWRGNSGGSLCSLLGRELGYESCETPARLAEQIAETLQSVDLLLELHFVHRFEGSLASSLAGFVEEFWKPIAAAIARKNSRRLLAFLTLECATDARTSWSGYVQAALGDAGAPGEFDPLLAIELPRMEAIRAGEVIRWLGRWKTEAEATLIAERLIQETGGNPSSLRRRLREASIWTN